MGEYPNPGSAAGSSRAWDVLLIGGPSGVGKSSVSYPMALRLGIGITEIDDLQLAVQRLTTPEQLPALHYFRSRPLAQELPPEQILQRFIDLCHAVAPAIIAVAENHIESHSPIVLEGDYLLPDTAAALVAEPMGLRTRAVFLYEEDEARIVANYLEREPSAGVQDKRARVSWLHGQWLRSECARLGLLAIPARPWQSLMARMFAAIK